jgi:hypothetical protein
MNMMNKRLFEEGDPLEPDESEVAERMRLLAPDDPTYDAWLKKKYGRNPYLKAPKVKVRRSSKRPRRS